MVRTDNEKIAEVATGIENDGLVFNMNSQKSVDELIDQQARTKHNQQVADYVERLDRHQAYLDKYAEKFKDDMKGLEIKPLYRQVLFRPFEQNPFQAVKREGTIITDIGGLNPIYKSNETGEWEEEESAIGVGLVMEVGPKVEYVRTGDVIMYPKTGEVPVPFYKQGFVVCDEQRVIAVINEGLTERFEK